MPFHAIIMSDTSAATNVHGLAFIDVKLHLPFVSLVAKPDQILL